MKNIEPIDDVCGKIKELHHSDNLSIAYVTITGMAKPHMHKIMEEVYYIIKGEGLLHIDFECRKIQPGDIIPIPKEKYHYLKNTNDKPL